MKCFVRHSVHLHACLVILKLQSGHCDQQSFNKRACNQQACNKRLYGTIASHDEAWQFHRYIAALIDTFVALSAALKEHRIGWSDTAWVITYITG